MRAVAAERENTEKPFKFVVNVGDNFYPAGVSSVTDPGVLQACTEAKESIDLLILRMSNGSGRSLEDRMGQHLSWTTSDEMVWNIWQVMMPSSVPVLMT